MSKEQFDYIKAEYDLLVYERGLLTRKVSKFLVFDILLTMLLLLILFIATPLLHKCIYLVILVIHMHGYLKPLIELRLINQEINKKLTELESLG